jgi:hypothetical protein
MSRIYLAMASRQKLSFAAFARSRAALHLAQVFKNLSLNSQGIELSALNYERNYGISQRNHTLSQGRENGHNLC